MTLPVCQEPAVAINGFGRLGKSLLDVAFRKDFNVNRTYMLIANGGFGKFIFKNEFLKMLTSKIAFREAD